jgi:transcriptional regulator with XRE-family HTH domain
MTATVGPLLRDWRQRRRMSQLDLAVQAEVSARHLSFVETGRSRPSPELVLHLAEQLEVPLRERNTLLLAAGYAPRYPQTAFDDPEMAPVRAALQTILDGHEPFPAMVVDRHWNIVAANAPTLTILGELVSPTQLEPPVNAMRVCLHSDGLSPYIENLAEYGNHLIARVEHQARATGDGGLIALADELRGYLGDAAEPKPADDMVALLFVPLTLRTALGRLRLFGTVATFGTALDITLSELAIESFFPADDETTDALRAPRS